MLSQTTLLLALAASASAHMIMDFPKPFGRATLDSSPLVMADFPCKQRAGVYDNDLGTNQWNAGETKPVSFNGTAVHSGGSCQFSITTDETPNLKSQWKVIHSVEGNCLTTQDGNFEDTSATISPLLTKKATDVPVTMPSNIPDGLYTFAWTWLNKEGNREFYMNCAPIQVGSSSGKASTQSAAQALSALPDMFVTNLPTKPATQADCHTNEKVDFVYPDPGQSVVKGSVNVIFDNTVTGPACSTMTKMGAGAGEIKDPSAGTPSTPTEGSPSESSSAPSQPQYSQNPVASAVIPVKGDPQPSKIPTNPNGGVLAPGASSAPAISTPTPEPQAPVINPTPPAADPAPSTPQNGGDNNTTPSNGECTPCTNDGAVVCIGSNQFGLCNRGCAVAQDLAAGMACSAGTIVAATKRSVHFPRAHLHRRFSAARLL